MRSGNARWRSSEGIAARVLEDLGFKILEEHHAVTVDGVEVGEVDILAERDGELYAVEVKAGRLDVGGVRQAHVNAEILGAKPLVICRGFSDSSAEALARRLGVEVILESDLFLVDPDELFAVVREAVEEALQDVLSYLAQDVELSEDELKLLGAISEADDVQDAAERLGVELRELASRLETLRAKGILPRRASSFASLRRAAKLFLAAKSLGRERPSAPP